MNVVVFGASGMIGGGVLRECIDDEGVSSVVSVGRSPCGLDHPKLREVLVPDLLDIAHTSHELRGADACLYCLGVSSVGTSETEYRRATVGLTVAVADAFAEASPAARFCFVSGQGTDAEGKAMWARVKAEAERYLLDGPLDAYMFRPGFIQPLRGVRSRTRLYRVLYAIAAPVTPLLVGAFPGFVTTTVAVGRAMLRVAQGDHTGRVLETRDINALVT